jgi:hypothetical protein
VALHCKFKCSELKERNFGNSITWKTQYVGKCWNINYFQNMSLSVVKEDTVIFRFQFVYTSVSSCVCLQAFLS